MVLGVFVSSYRELLCVGQCKPRVGESGRKVDGDGAAVKRDRVEGHFRVESAMRGVELEWDWEVL
jgi:hypothetical protein